jgi:hypothetical protein
MKQYKLHMIPEKGGVPFATFRQFFHAMETTEAIMAHFSKVIYRFSDSTQTEYRLQSDPTHVSSQPDTPDTVFTCHQRPNSYVHAYNQKAEVLKKSKAKGIRSNTFKTVIQTELIEIWTYIMEKRTYILSKTGTASTKEHASKADPRFHITINSEEKQCVHDLFGRFVNGTEEQITYFILSIYKVRPFSRVSVTSK